MSVIVNGSMAEIEFHHPVMKLTMFAIVH